MKFVVKRHCIKGYQIAFFLMLAFPFQLQYVKLALIVSSLLVGIHRAKQGVRLYGDFLIWCALYIFGEFFPILYGIILRNPAPMLYFNTSVLWPILFLLTSIYINRDVFEKLMVTMKMAFLVIVISGILAWSYFNINDIDYGSFLGFDAMIRPGFPFIAIFSPSVTNMLFLFPFFIVLSFFEKNKLNKWIVGLGICFVIATTRKTFLLSLILSLVTVNLFLPHINFINITELRKRMRRIFSNMLLLAVPVFALGFVFFSTEILDFFEAATGFANKEIGDSVRTSQMEALVVEGLQSPIFGHGAGLNCSIVRSDLPGTYEMSYHAKFFSSGFVGLGLFVLLIFILHAWFLKALTRPGGNFKKYLFAWIVGLDMFLFSNATNPYLVAFDHMWILFLSFALLIIDRKYEASRFNKSIQSS